MQPKMLYVHYCDEPNTFWWNRAKQDREINMTLIKSRRIESIFNKPVDHHSHRGDIIRIEVLLKYGGIYLDSDVLILRSFDPLLNLGDVIMANQDNDQHTACNAVIISRKNSVFLKRLHDAYQSFNQKLWDYHSVRLPGILAHIYSDEIKLLPTDTFFSPGNKSRKDFLMTTNYNFSNNYASHLWNKVQRNALNNLTAQSILNGSFLLAQMLKKALGNETFIELSKIPPQYFA